MSQRHTSHLSRLLVQLVYTFPERSRYTQGSPKHQDCKMAVWSRPHIPGKEVFFLVVFFLHLIAYKLFSSPNLLPSSSSLLQLNYYILTKDTFSSFFLFMKVKESMGISSTKNHHSRNSVNALTVTKSLR